MKQKRFACVGLLVLALVATVFYLFPLVLVAINSIKTTGEFTSNPFSLPTIPQWGNYAYAFEQMHFLTSMRNSLVITVSVCVLVSLLGAMAAYAVSRVKHKFVSTVYYLMLASMCAPFQAYMIPLVKIYASQLGMNNSLIPVIYIGLGLNICFSIFLVRGFLNSIPKGDRRGGPHRRVQQHQAVLQHHHAHAHAHPGDIAGVCGHGRMERLSAFQPVPQHAGNAHASHDDPCVLRAVFQ